MIRFRSFFNKSGEKKQPSPEEVDAFVNAAHEGNEKAVRDFCKKYPNHIDHPDKDGNTALYAAVGIGDNNITIGDILLEAKADPNKPDRFGCSPFYNLVRTADNAYANHKDFYPFLDSMLKNGANVNYQHQAWTDLSDGFKGYANLTTPLIMAAEFQNEKLCDYLLKNGANPLLKDARGQTAKNCVETRLFGDDPNETTDSIITKLEKAEKEWAQKPSSVNEWRGKVTPNNWQGH
jgi:hypothetical protein